MMMMMMPKKLSYLTNILHSLTKLGLHLCPKPATITFVSFAVSGPTLIPQLPVPLLVSIILSAADPGSR